MASIPDLQLALKSLLTLALTVGIADAWALESDRQQPLEVNADTTNGILGDGITTLSGNVEIRQGTLLILADEAEVDKTDGRVRQIRLLGDSASLQQEIEDQGTVKAWARVIEYQVGSGIVMLRGGAEVKHPQYDISGDQLRYDLNAQHFEGNGDAGGNGRVHIRLDPEVAGEPVADPESSDEDTPPVEPPDNGNS